MRMSDNTIFIPGATSGIGRGLAERLADRGNRVIVGGRRRALLAEISAGHPGIEAVYIDTADAESIRTVSVQVQEEFPETNVVVPMAGIMRPEDVPTGEFLADAEAIVATNLLGPIRLVAAFAPFLAGKDGATVVTVSSGLAFTPLAFTPTYNATKAAVHALSETYRLQLAAVGVQVIELVPPAVATDLMPGPFEMMPLTDYLDETIALLEAEPDAREILVEQVKPLRFSVRDGSYDHLVAALAGHA